MSEFTGSTQPTNAVNPTGPAAQSSYVTRAIDVTITLGEGTFGQTGANTVKLSGLRVVASISKSPSPSFDKASLRIYGLSPDLMNQLSTLGVPQQMIRVNNVISITAGDAVNGMASVYVGTLNRAYQSLDDAPDTFLQVEGWQGPTAALIPVTPTSYPGGADVATMMATLAAKMTYGGGKVGLGFENNGVQVQLSSPYYAGTYMDQAQAIARDANINMYIDTNSDPPVLAIWPKNKTRGGAVPLIQASSGLIGYPKFEQFGISFRCIFNPSIRCGGVVQINSTLYPPSSQGQSGTAAQMQAAGPNGYWHISALSLNLASQLPDGPWFCECSGTRAQQPLSQ